VLQTLLKELEEFAFRGIPDARICLETKTYEVKDEMVRCIFNSTS
jgi:hypothetical protein